MKQNKAGEDLCLRTQTTNQNIKKNAQSESVDGMPALPVLYMSQQNYVSGEDRGNGSKSPAPHASTEATAT